MIDTGSICFLKKLRLGPRAINLKLITQIIPFKGGPMLVYFGGSESDPVLIDDPEDIQRFCKSLGWEYLQGDAETVLSQLANGTL